MIYLVTYLLLLWSYSQVHPDSRRGNIVPTFDSLTSHCRKSMWDGRYCWGPSGKHSLPHRPWRYSSEVIVVVNLKVLRNQFGWNREFVASNLGKWIGIQAKESGLGSVDTSESSEFLLGSQWQWEWYSCRIFCHVSGGWRWYHNRVCLKSGYAVIGPCLGGV